MRRRLAIFCDNEGCLVEGKGIAFNLSLLDSVGRWLRQEPRVDFGLCTGRSIPYVEAMVQALGLTESEFPNICEGGASLYWPRREKDGEIGAPPYESLSEFDDSTLLKMIGNVLPKEAFRVELGKLGCLSLYPNAGWTVERLADLVRFALFDSANYSVLCSVAAVDITFAGVNKASAIREVCRRLSIRQEKVVCIGDSGNDIPMLEIAGFAACPSNAAEKVKELCHYVSPHASTAGVLDILHMSRRKML